jgi:anti-sigma regulatory factor (Ser/Thr protein kinase)
LADQGAYARLREFALAEADKADLPPGMVDKVELVLEEVLLNVIHYAYPQDRPGEVSLGCAQGPGEWFYLRVQDRGRPFNPLEHQAPDLTGGVLEREVGGLGIFLTRQISDYIAYHRQDGQNILEIGLRTQTG